MTAKQLDKSAEIATQAITAKGLPQICGEVIWVRNDYLARDVPAVCLVTFGTEHEH